MPSLPLGCDVVFVRNVPRLRHHPRARARPRLRGRHQEHARLRTPPRLLVRRRVASSNTVQGTAAATGLGALIVRAQPVFEALKWAGVAYLIYLGAQALRSAVRGRYAPLEGGTTGRPSAAGDRASSRTSPTRRSSSSTWPYCRSSSPQERERPCSWPSRSPTPRCRCSTCSP
jgi:LysE type translocator